MHVQLLSSWGVWGSADLLGSTTSDAVVAPVPGIGKSLTPG